MFLMYSIEASSHKDLSNKLASYIRRGYDVAQILINNSDDKPYKAFLINKKILKDISNNVSNETIEEIE